MCDFNSMCNIKREQLFKEIQDNLPQKCNIIYWQLYTVILKLFEINKIQYKLVNYYLTVYAV